MTWVGLLEIHFPKTSDHHRRSLVKYEAGLLQHVRSHCLGLVEFFTPFFEHRHSSLTQMQVEIHFATKDCASMSLDRLKGARRQGRHPLTVRMEGVQETSRSHNRAETIPQCTARHATTPQNHKFAFIVSKIPGPMTEMAKMELRHHIRSHTGGKLLSFSPSRSSRSGWKVICSVKTQFSPDQVMARLSASTWKKNRLHAQITNHVIFTEQFPIPEDGPVSLPPPTLETLQEVPQFENVNLHAAAAPSTSSPPPLPGANNLQLFANNYVRFLVSHPNRMNRFNKTPDQDRELFHEYCLLRALDMGEYLQDPSSHLDASVSGIEDVESLASFRMSDGIYDQKPQATSEVDSHIAKSPNQVPSFIDSIQRSVPMALEEAGSAMSRPAESTLQVIKTESDMDCSSESPVFLNSDTKATSAAASRSAPEESKPTEAIIASHTMNLTENDAVSITSHEVSQISRSLGISTHLYPDIEFALSSCTTGSMVENAADNSVDNWSVLTGSDVA